jgi:hypothetical protein
VAGFGVSAAKDETKVAVLVDMLRQRKARRIGNFGQGQWTRLAMAGNSAMKSWWKSEVLQRRTSAAEPDPSEYSEL